MDEKKLWKHVRRNAKPAFKAFIDNNNKPANIIANKGLKSGQIAVRGSGEYNGFAIKALEDIKPILTDLRMSKALKRLTRGDIQGAVAILRLNEEVIEGGLGVLYGVIKQWLDKNDIPIPSEYSQQALIIKSSKLQNWVLATTFSPVQGRFEIYDIGSRKTGQSVVPESWLGRIFDNADHLHEEMDKLDWRKGKPAVNFCCIYAMYIKKIREWNPVSEETYKLNVLLGISIAPKITKEGHLQTLNSNVIFFDKKIKYAEWLDSLPKQLLVMDAPLGTPEPNQKLLLACDLEKTIIINPQYQKTKNVGLLVSTMQKLIRRGRGCSSILKDTMTKLWKSPGYNLPEQQFLRVNGCRQLAWRLFISTIEDAEAYADSDHLSNTYYCSMLDLACLAILANITTEIQFTESVFQSILYTGLLIQHNENKWDLYQKNDGLLDKDITDITEITHNKMIQNSHPNSNLLKAFMALAFYMPMRSGDFDMITKSYNLIQNNYFKPRKLETLQLKQLLSFSNRKESLDGELAGMDMIAYPTMLLLLQCSLPFIPNDPQKHTTKGLSGFIWNYSSNINVRKKDSRTLTSEDLEILKILKLIQENLLFPKKLNLSNLESSLKKYSKSNLYYEKKANKISESDSRLGFLLFFGQKTSITHKGKKYDVIVAGTNDAPCRIKSIIKGESQYLEDEDRFLVEKSYVQYLNENNYIIDSPTPPIGYSWVWESKKRIRLNAKIISSNTDEWTNKILFFADDYELKPFDTRNIMVPLKEVHPTKMDPEIEDLVKQLLYFEGKYNWDHYQINLIAREIEFRQLQLFDWYPIAKTSPIPYLVWKLVLVKLYDNQNNEIQIGPVDSMGHKLQYSINYLYEGTILRIFNMLSMLYPNTIIPKTTLKFVINPKTPEYMHLQNTLKTIATKTLEQKPEVKRIDIITKLWEHQKKTSDKILERLLIYNERGFGDASNVGAGKTLTALTIMAGLYNHNMKIRNYDHHGFLILLPTTYLYKTWQDEIVKHTKGFDIILQNADGSITGKIKPHTLLITTLGRMRDHPLSQPWIFTVIDECLSVQNRDALQTGEAWKQILFSQYRCLLMSATFFRTRFDKLFYMLKMLGSGLPENKAYLDAILLERIVSFIPKKIREWSTNVHYFELGKADREIYNDLLKQEISSERLYSKLQAFLHENFDYVSAFKNIIKKIGKRRALIYSKSREEADQVAEEIESVSRFPDISGEHVVISYTEGTYGLNQLVFLNTIISRPPQPDKLPQMKGRLDRYGQKSEKLSIEYLIIRDTIDEASLFNLELANSFYNNYILPLADFYDIAVGRKSKTKILS